MKKFLKKFYGFNIEQKLMELLQKEAKKLNISSTSIIERLIADRYGYDDDDLPAWKKEFLIWDYYTNTKSVDQTVEKFKVHPVQVIDAKNTAMKKFIEKNTDINNYPEWLKLHGLPVQPLNPQQPL